VIRALVIRMRIDATLQNIRWHWHAFWLRSMNPMAPAPLLRKHLLPATDLQRRTR
jgi:hypothetical protein